MECRGHRKLMRQVSHQLVVGHNADTYPIPNAFINACQKSGCPGEDFGAAGWRGETEILSAFTGYQNIAFGVGRNLAGDAAEKKPLNAMRSSGAKNDHVRAKCFGRFQDFARRVSKFQYRLGGYPLVGQ